MGEEVGEVDPGVVEGLVEGAADGGGDLVLDEVVVEVVEVEGEVRECGEDGAAEAVVVVEGGEEEVEGEVLGAGGVLEDGEDGGDGAAEVGGVEGHGDVDCVTGGGGWVGFGAFLAVTEGWGFAEVWEGFGGGCRRRM